MDTRICAICRVEKPLEQFYRCRSKPLGRDYRCKDCFRVIRRKLDKTPKRILKSKEWLKSEKGKELYRRRYAQNKIQVRVYRTIQRLIKAGIILRQPCEICGTENGNAHHPDYSQPLKIVWLCQKHHAEIHWKKPSPQFK